MARNKLDSRLTRIYARDDHIGWSNLMAQQGHIMPQDNDQIRHTYLIAKMREAGLPMSVRIEARQMLIDLSIIADGDEPIRPSEKLKKAKAKMLVPGSAKQTLKNYPEYDEFVLVMPNDAMRNVMFRKWAEELVGLLDKVRSNIRHSELYTLDGKHIKFLEDGEDYDLPIADVAFREIANVS